MLVPNAGQAASIVPLVMRYRLIRFRLMMSAPTIEETEACIFTVYMHVPTCSVLVGVCRRHCCRTNTIRVHAVIVAPSGVSDKAKGNNEGSVLPKQPISMADSLYRVKVSVASLQ